MTGFLNIINKGDALPFQNLNADLFWRDNAIAFDYLPTFFSKQLRIANDVTEIKIHKIDVNKAKLSENYTDLQAAITETTTLSNPADFIKLIIKTSGLKVFKSYYEKKLTNNLETGLYFLEFTDGINEFMSDVFCVKNISHDIIGTIQNLFNSYLIFENTVLDNSGNNLDALLYNAPCLNCTTSTKIYLLDDATITALNYSGTAKLIFSGSEITVTDAGTLYDLTIKTDAGTRQFPICEGANDLDILHNILSGDLNTNIVYKDATWTLQNEYFPLYNYKFDIVENTTKTSKMLIPRKIDDSSNVI